MQKKISVFNVNNIDISIIANLKKAIPAICLDMINKETEKMLPRQTTCIDS